MSDEVVVSVVVVVVVVVVTSDTTSEGNLSSEGGLCSVEVSVEFMLF